VIAAVIPALLDHIRSGEPVSEELKAAAHESSQDLYALSENLPRSERYDLPETPN